MTRSLVRAFLSLAILLLAACGDGDGDRSRPRELIVGNLDSVSVFDASLGGNISPLSVVANASEPRGISGMTVDVASDEMFVADGDAVTAYAKTPDGNRVPVRRISGDSTTLRAPQAIAAAPGTDELFVANNTGDAITVFARTAGGDAPPLRTISGGATGLDFVLAMAVDTANNEIMVTNGDNRILVFAGTAQGNVPPLRTLTPSGGQLRGIAVDTVNNELYVAEFTIIDRFNFTTSVIVYERTAEGNAVPLRAIVGSPSAFLGTMTGIVVDPVNNELFVSTQARNSSSNSVVVYERTASGNAVPLRVIAGDATGLNAPSVLALGAP